MSALTGKGALPGDTPKGLAAIMREQGRIYLGYPHVLTDLGTSYAELLVEGANDIDLLVAALEEIERLSNFGDDGNVEPLIKGPFRTGYGFLRQIRDVARVALAKADGR